MKPGNSGVVLLYNCSGPEYSKLKQVFAMLRLRMHPVGPERYHVPLEELSRGGGEPAREPPQAIPEPMLVFCGLGGVFLDQVLNVLRTAQLPPISLKAVLTKTNRDWTTLRLYEELTQEREAMSRAQG